MSASSHRRTFASSPGFTWRAWPGSESAHEHSQPHACFIQSVADDLVNEGGIMELWVKSLEACVDEARAKRRIVA